MNYENEIIINDKISMISWMRLKVINRTSLFINHSSATRSVDHISLPPQVDLECIVFDNIGARWYNFERLP